MNLYSNIKSAFAKLKDSKFLSPFINMARKVKDAIIINKIDVRPIHRKSQDIQTWRNALKAAEGTGQQRKLLYDLYHDILLDGFLKRVIAKRIQAVTNTDLTLTIDGKEVEGIDNITDKSFFETFLVEILKSRFWGHTLVEVNWDKEGEGWTKLVNRSHVKPRFGIVTRNAYDMDGISYREEPFDRQAIEAGGDEDLGDILEACQYVIYKRGNFGDWAHFAEVFGMPFRWATYNSPETREVLKTAMEEAGSAGYVVAPEDADIQFLSNANMTGTMIFKQLKDACNEEIAIAILGNTMTTREASSSGYAQSKTHLDVQQELHKDDRKFLLRVLNEKLTPYLESIGFNVKGAKWSFSDEENLSLKERIEIDLKVASKVPVGQSYWYEKYGIPKPSADDLPADTKEGDDEE